MVKHRSFEQTSNVKRDFPLSRHVQISISAPFCYRMCLSQKKVQIYIYDAKNVSCGRLSFRSISSHRDI